MNPRHGANHRCAECDAKQYRSLNPAKNAISALAYGIAGGSRRFYSLSREDRLATRDAATRLHARGMKFAAAGQEVDAAKEGFVYVISNPAWPGFVKIGRAAVVADRLATFQTGCPHRAYKVEGAAYAADAVAVEAACHVALSLYRADGEWFKVSPAVAVSVVFDYSDTATIAREAA